MIELKGIVQRYDLGHKYVEVVIIEDNPDIYKRHRMGVDIKVNRGKILTFLAGLYSIPPGEIVWPEHIILKEGDD